MPDDWIFSAIKAGTKGQGRGNWGHAGRPGLVGGSSTSTGSGIDSPVGGYIKSTLDRYVRRYGEDQETARVVKDKRGDDLLLVADQSSGSPIVTAYRDDGQHVGTISFNYSDDGKKLLLWRQVVVDDQQRRGINTLMLQRARERWGKEIQLDTLSPLTSQGQAFWESTQKKQLEVEFNA